MTESSCVALAVVGGCGVLWEGIASRQAVKVIGAAAPTIPR
jgi:hypothetical protein